MRIDRIELTLLFCVSMLMTSCLKSSNESSWILPTGETFTLSTNRLNQNKAFVADMTKTLIVTTNEGSQTEFVISKIGGAYEGVAAFYNPELNLFWVTREKKNTGTTQMIAAYDLEKKTFFDKSSLNRNSDFINNVVNKAHSNKRTINLKKL